MRTAPYPPTELEDESDEAKIDAWHDSVGKSDWKTAPGGVLITVDRLLEEHGLEVRVYDFRGDQVVYDIVKKEA